MARILTGRRALRRRMKDVQRELSAVRNDIRALEKGKAAPRRAAPSRPRVVPSGMEKTDDPVESLLEAEKKQPKRPLDEGRLAQEERAIKERAKTMRDDRFVDYLASSFEAGGDSLRYERRIQRNKAMVLAIVVLAVLTWVLRRLFG